MDKIGQLVGMMALFVGVVIAAYGASRWMGSRMGLRMGGRLLRAREWLPIGRDRSLVLIEAGGRLLLVGAGPQGIALLANLGAAAAAEQTVDNGILRGGDSGAMPCGPAALAHRTGGLTVPVAARLAHLLTALARNLPGRIPGAAPTPADRLPPFAQSLARAVSGPGSANAVPGPPLTAALDLEPVLRRLRQVATGGGGGRGGPSPAPVVARTRVACRQEVSRDHDRC